MCPFICITNKSLFFKKYYQKTSQYLSIPISKSYEQPYFFLDLS